MTDLAERLRIACDLADFGLAIQRQNLRRAHPELDGSALDELLLSWREQLGRPDAKQVIRGWPRRP